MDTNIWQTVSLEKPTQESVNEGGSMFPHVRNDNRADAGLQWVLSRNLFPPVEKEELGA